MLWDFRHLAINEQPMERADPHIGDAAVWGRRELARNRG
jgi:hypothetical protein